MSDLPLFDYASEHERNVAAPAPQPACSGSAATLPADFHALVAALEDRVGVGRCLTALQIAEAGGIHPDGTPGSRARRVRHLVELHYPDLPWPVVADSNGFYRPAGAEDIEHYHANLHSRLGCLAVRIRHVRTVALRAGYAYTPGGHYAGPDQEGGGRMM